MSNGEQAQEGAESANKSADWQSPNNDAEEESDDSYDEEEEVDSPRRTKRQSK